MKKFILISIGLFCFALLGKAQTIPMTASTATVTNTATVTLTAQVKGANNVVSIEYIATKTSGTVAGTATLYGSVNGVTYSVVPTGIIKGAANAYTNTDVTKNSYVWVITPSVYQYYQVQIAGSGTMVATVSGTVLTR